MKVRISILIGIYNCASTLNEALNSLLNQTYQGFKVIMCDDGSTDSTYSIAKSYTDKYDNFILIRNEKNMGLNYTLNHCLEYADTEYCARMDGDDVCDPTRLEKQINFLDTHPQYAFVSCPMIMFDEKGSWGKTKLIQYPTKDDVLLKSPCFTHAAVMIRTNVYKEVGGYTIDKRLLRVEDCHLWFKIYAAGYEGANLEEALYSMRDDRNATSRRTWMSRRNAIYVMFCGYKMFGKPWYSYFRLLVKSAIEVIKFIMPVAAYEYFHKKNNLN